MSLHAVIDRICGPMCSLAENWTFSVVPAGYFITAPNSVMAAVAARIETQSGPRVALGYRGHRSEGYACSSSFGRIVVSLVD